jgi:hypothetical protein
VLWVGELSMHPIRIAAQRSAAQCSALQCSAAQCIALHCIALQCSAVQCRALPALPWWASLLRFCIAMHCAVVELLHVMGAVQIPHHYEIQHGVHAS